MKLTGKCKKDFEKWFFNNYGIEEASFVRGEGGFFNLPQSMQYGVLVDFFDSVGIYINAFSPDYFEIHTGWDVVMNEGKVDRSRSEAREEAIKKFNKIYNEHNI